jgi:hypothetical protein
VPRDKVAYGNREGVRALIGRWCSWPVKFYLLGVKRVDIDGCRKEGWVRCDFWLTSSCMKNSLFYSILSTIYRCICPK